MARKQTLTIDNLEEGNVKEALNDALKSIQTAAFDNKAKASLTLKIEIDAVKSQQIAGVKAELSTSIPKKKMGGLYNRGEHFLVADPIPESKGTQGEIDGVTKVVEMNRNAG